MDAQSGRLFSEEREYGKIPKRIYLQYLQACSVCAGATYLVSTFGWQGLRVYTDYCLNQWTNSGNTGNTTVPHTLDYEVRKFPQALSTDNIVISVVALDDDWFIIPSFCWTLSFVFEVFNVLHCFRSKLYSCLQINGCKFSGFQSCAVEKFIIVMYWPFKMRPLRGLETFCNKHPLIECNIPAAELSYNRFSLYSGF